MDLVEIINIIKSIIPTKEEHFNQSLVSLYQALKNCHLCYEEWQADVKSEKKASKHKKSVEHLSELFSDYYDFFVINGDGEITNDIGMYIALEGYSNARYYKDFESMSENIRRILNRSGSGDFRNASKVLENYLKENIKDKNSLFYSLGH
jgi:hypothetical protein